MLLDNQSTHLYEKSVPNRTTFDKIDNPARLHFIAARYNLDNGPLLLKWIIESPLCDKGTAKLIFWNASPNYYTQFRKDTVSEFDKGIYNLLRTIIRNFESGFYKKGNYTYNPSNYDDVDYVNPNAQWSIPAILKSPTRRLNTPNTEIGVRYRIRN